MQLKSPVRLKKSTTEQNISLGYMGRLHIHQIMFCSNGFIIIGLNCCFSKSRQLHNRIVMTTHNNLILLPEEIVQPQYI